MSGDSEEKTLAPTEHKLRKSREKGQVANSSDFVTALSVIVGVVYIAFSWKSIAATAARVFELSIFSMGNSDPSLALGVFLSVVFEVGYVIAPFIIAIVLTGILANLLDKGGVPFSLDPIKPNFEKINPGAGLKKLFARRNITEFAISFVKICIWIAIAGVIYWLFLPSLLATVHCSLGCVLEGAYSIGLLMVVAASIMLLFTGMLDLPLQRMLFHHEQKMGHKELKREQKDINGAPEFKSHRRQEHQRLVEPGTTPGEESNGKPGMPQSLGTAFIIRGYETAVAIYFHKENADVPLVAGRFRGSELHKKVSEAESAGMHVEYDQELTNDIFKSVDVGKVIRERHFEKVARVLVQIGAI